MLSDEPFSDLSAHRRFLIVQTLQVRSKFLTCLLDFEQLGVLFAGGEELVLHVNLSNVGFCVLLKGQQHSVGLSLDQIELRPYQFRTLASRTDFTSQKIDKEIVKLVPIFSCLAQVYTHLWVLLQNPNHFDLVLVQLFSHLRILFLAERRQQLLLINLH